MSNFDQISAGKWVQVPTCGTRDISVGTRGVSRVGGYQMLKADQFRQYAEEAMRRASQSKCEKELLALLDLAHAWTQAAAASKSKDEKQPSAIAA
jgi:hypothetical protein